MFTVDRKLDSGGTAVDMHMFIDLSNDQTKFKCNLNTSLHCSPDRPGNPLSPFCPWYPGRPWKPGPPAKPFTPSTPMDNKRA